MIENAPGWEQRAALPAHTESCKGNVHETRGDIRPRDWERGTEGGVWWAPLWTKLCPRLTRPSGGPSPGLTRQGQGKEVREECPGLDQPWVCCKFALGSWAKPFLCLGLSFPNCSRQGLGQLRSKSLWLAVMSLDAKSNRGPSLPTPSFSFKGRSGLNQGCHPWAREVGARDRDSHLKSLSGRRVKDAARTPTLPAPHPQVRKEEGEVIIG